MCKCWKRLQLCHLTKLNDTWYGKSSKWYHSWIKLLCIHFAIAAMSGKLYTCTSIVQLDQSTNMVVMIRIQVPAAKICGYRATCNKDRQTIHAEDWEYHTTHSTTQSSTSTSVIRDKARDIDLLAAVAEGLACSTDGARRIVNLDINLSSSTHSL